MMSLFLELNGEKKRIRSRFFTHRKKNSKQNVQINFDITINKFIFLSFQTPRIKCNQQKNRLHNFFFSTTNIGRPLTHLKKKKWNVPPSRSLKCKRRKREIFYDKLPIEQKRSNRGYIGYLWPHLNDNIRQSHFRIFRKWTLRFHMGIWNFFFRKKKRATRKREWWRSKKNVSLGTPSKPSS